MKPCMIAGGLVAVVCLAASLTTVAAPGPAGEGEHDFGSKVLIVATKPIGGKNDAGGSYLIKAKIRKLGDRYFVVGELADLGEFQIGKGAVIWTPLSEVVQMTEYDDLETVKKILTQLPRQDR